MSSSDKRIRDLERKAVVGDQEAEAALLRHRQRIDPWSPWDVVGIGEWVYVEAGPNYHEVGKLREVRHDALNVAWGILDKCRRKNDENDAGPTWMGSTGDGIAIPSTACSLIQAARNRWPRERFW